MYQVLEFTENGARGVYKGTNEDEARRIYAGLDHAQLMRLEGRDESGEMIPGVMAENFFLERK
jgi:hypothetical protein